MNSHEISNLLIRIDEFSIFIQTVFNLLTVQNILQLSNTSHEKSLIDID